MSAFLYYKDNTDNSFSYHNDCCYMLRTVLIYAIGCCPYINTMPIIPLEPYTSEKKNP